MNWDWEQAIAMCGERLAGAIEDGDFDRALRWAKLAWIIQQTAKADA